MTASPPQKNNRRASGPNRPGGGNKAVVADNVCAALDLGTNNCRLLIAQPTGSGFRVIDGFSRIVRLGEGVSEAGALSDAAIQRTVDALKVCANKMSRRRVSQARCVATQAARSAGNSAYFVNLVKRGNRDRYGDHNFSGRGGADIDWVLFSARICSRSRTP